jgi:hypothetical protein
MARRIANRKQLRAEAEAAEAAGEKKKKPAKKKAATRKTKAKDKQVRLKAFWGVFDHTLKRVAMFEYSERRQADRKAKELTDKKKRPHFVQQVKEPVED